MQAQTLDTFTILQVLFFAIPVLVGIALLAYLAMRRRQYPRPVGLAMLAIALMTFTHVGIAIANVVIPRYVGVEQLPIVFSATSIVSAIIRAITVFMLIAAVFLDRDKTPNPTYRSVDVGGTPLSDQPSDNPYAGPRN